MEKTKELSEDRNGGKGCKGISKLFRVPVASIQSIIKNQKEFHTVKKC